MHSHRAWRAESEEQERCEQFAVPVSCAVEESESEKQVHNSTPRFTCSRGVREQQQCAQFAVKSVQHQRLALSTAPVQPLSPFFITPNDSCHLLGNHVTTRQCRLMIGSPCWVHFRTGLH